MSSRTVLPVVVGLALGFLALAGVFPGGIGLLEWNAVRAEAQAQAQAEANGRAEAAGSEDRGPSLDEKAILADCRWTQEHWIDEHLSPYRGTHVAVFGGEVVGSGDDATRLQLDLARRLNVHPQRVIVTYVPRGGGVL